MERDNYEIKFDLLRKKYHNIQLQNEKLQNRIYNIRKQIQFMRTLKRIIIQKLLVYGDRFMEVCLEIPDMEPGANVEDKIINVVAEAPKPIKPAPQIKPTTTNPPSATTTTSSKKKRPATSSAAAIPAQNQPASGTTAAEICKKRKPSSSVVFSGENKAQKLPNVSVKVTTPIPTTVKPFSVIPIFSGTTIPPSVAPKKKKRYPNVLKKPASNPQFNAQKIQPVHRPSGSDHVTRPPMVLDPLKSANLDDVVNSVIQESQQTSTAASVARVTISDSIFVTEIPPPDAVQNVVDSLVPYRVNVDFSEPTPDTSTEPSSFLDFFLG